MKTKLNYSRVGGTHPRFGIGRNAGALRFQIVALAIVAAVALAGCDSISSATSSVRQTIADRDPPRIHVFKAEQRETYAAALKAIERIGFRFVRGGAAQGKLEAVSGLVAGRSLESTQQLSLKASLEVSPEGGTEVQLHLYETIEADETRGAGQGVAAPMRDTPLYESFFRELQHALDEANKS